MKITTEQILELPITDVYEGEPFTLYNIHFTINGFDFFLTLEEDSTQSNVSVLKWVQHKTPNGTCPVCKNPKAVYCVSLGDQKVALMNRLKEFPKIRLKWLYESFII